MERSFFDIMITFFHRFLATLFDIEPIFQKKTILPFDSFERKDRIIIAFG